ncbi:MAG: hypothetical protein U9O65_00005, partial [Thermotogota bacterium]|nr:hypothetical protein [Thermotogota bacterium]
MREYVFVAVIISVIFGFTARSTFAEYYPQGEEDCTEVEIDPYVPQEIKITFTASPKSGDVPLDITFECEAEAYVHWANLECVSGPQGSVTNTEPLYDWVEAQSVSYPEDVVTLNSPGIHDFSAEADYEDMVEEKNITYECPDRNNNTEFITDGKTKVTYEDWFNPESDKTFECRVEIVTTKVCETRGGVRYGGEDFYDMRLITTVTKTYYDTVYRGCIWDEDITIVTLTGNLLPLAI